MSSGFPICGPYYSNFGDIFEKGIDANIWLLNQYKTGRYRTIETKYREKVGWINDKYQTRLVFVPMLIRETTVKDYEKLLNIINKLPICEDTIDAWEKIESFRISQMIRDGIIYDHEGWELEQKMKEEIIRRRNFISDYCNSFDKF